MKKPSLDTNKCYKTDTTATDFAGTLDDTTTPIEDKCQNTKSSLASISSTLENAGSTPYFSA